MTEAQIKKHIGKRVVVKTSAGEVEATLHGVSDSGHYVEVGLAQLTHRDNVLRLAPASKTEGASKTDVVELNAEDNANE